MSILLREVREDDLEMLREHRNRDDTRCWLGNDSVISAEQQQAWWSSGGARHLRVAHAGGRDVGLARVFVDDRGLGCVGSDVFAGHRGAGMGHGVFGAACEHAIAAGAKLLWLQVFIENTPAVRIYLRAGFSFSPGQFVTRFARRIPAYDRPVNLHYATMKRSAP